MKTILDVLEECWPNATWDQCDELMWLTPYPAGPADLIKERLIEMREKYGESIIDAIAGEMKAFDDACREHILNKEQS